MITKDDIAPGSLVRFKVAFIAAFHGRRVPTTRAHKVGVLIAFDHFGRVNPDKGDPLVLWVGEKKPVHMAGVALEIVS